MTMEAVQKCKLKRLSRPREREIIKGGKILG